MRKIDDKLMLQMLDQGKNQKDVAEFFNVSPAAVCKRVKRLSEPEGFQLPVSFTNLTEKEQRFIIAKAEGKTNIDSALSSYEVTSRQSAKSIGSNLMNKPEIQQALSDIMDAHGLTRDYRIKRLKQHVDNRDPNVSLKALDQSWKLDGSYAPEKETNIFSFSQIIEAACDLTKPHNDKVIDVDGSGEN